MADMILIVDSNQDRAVRMRDTLRSGFFTAEICDGTSAPDADVTRQEPALILMEGSDTARSAADLCSRVKSGLMPLAPPLVVMLPSSDLPRRLAVLGAGADDLLLRPFDDRVLWARMRSLIRIRAMQAELAERRETMRELGLDLPAAEPLAGVQVGNGRQPRILVIGRDQAAAQRIGRRVLPGMSAAFTVETSAFAALRVIEREKPDAVLVLDLGAAGSDSDANGFAEETASDPVQFIGALRGIADMRNVPILMMCDAGADPSRIAAALDAGASDVAGMTDMPEEVRARLKAQLSRKWASDDLKALLDDSIRLAVKDELTDLPLRRYFEPHLARLFAGAKSAQRPLAALMFDMDRFKDVNDRFGHAAGDVALKEFAGRLRNSVRASDLACRYGGEEFLVIAPDTNAAEARALAERIRLSLASRPVMLPGQADGQRMTISVGVAALSPDDIRPHDLVTRADLALHRAKDEGRNRVCVSKG